MLVFAFLAPVNTPAQTSSKISYVGSLGIGEANDVAVGGDYAYVTQYSCLRVIDVASPTAPVNVVCDERYPGGVEVFASGSHVFFMSSNFLYVLDVTTPTAPVEVGSVYISSNNNSDMHVNGDYAYVTDTSDGLGIIDISDPSNPDAMGSESTPGLAFDVYATGSYAYVADYSAGMRVIDISSATNPTEVGSFNTMAYNFYAEEVVVSNNYAYVGDGSELMIINVSSPDSPYFVELYDPSGPSMLHEMEMSGDYLYIAAGDGGLKVLDVSTPSNPVETAYYDTGNPISSLDLVGEYIYVTEYGSGRFVVLKHAVSDNSDPGVVDSQDGDDAVRSANDGTYDVDFTDSGGSYLDRIQVRACSTDANCGDLIDWTDVTTGLSPAESYTEDWPLPQAVWGAIPSGTGYISVRVFDVIGNQAEQGPVFYVVKSDTEPPEQVAWDPADGATLKNTTVTISITTDEAAKCRWSLQDLPYAEMENGCYGGLAVNTECDVNDLEEGSNSVYLACSDVDGNEQADPENVKLDYYVSFPYPAQEEIDSLNVGRVGFIPTGNIEHIYVTGKYAYAMNNGLDIYDVSDPAAISLVSSTYVDSRGEFYVSGSYVYMGLGSGVEIVDISDPSAPAEAGDFDFEVGMWCGSAESVLYEKYAYVTCLDNGLVIVDLSDRTAPSVVGELESIGTVEKIAVYGNYAYVTGWDSGLRVIDVSDPSAPVEVGFFSLSETIYDIGVDGNYVYLSSMYYGLYIVDVSDPGAPVQAGFYQPATLNEYIYFMVIDEGTVYVFTHSVEEMENYVVLLDVSNVSSPVEAERYEGIAGTGHFHDEKFYLRGFEGIQVYDISTPGSIVEAGSYQTIGTPEVMALNGDYAYIACSKDPDRLYTVDISDIMAPRIVSSIFGGYYVEDVEVSGSYLFVVDSSQMEVYDISEPEQPVNVTYFEAPDSIKAIDIQGDYAYLAHDNYGLRIVNISNPESPVEAGYYGEEVFIRAVAVSGNYAYIEEGIGVMSVLDISNPESPVKVGSLDVGTSFDVLRVSGNYVYMGDYSRMKIIDVSDPAIPIEVGSADKRAEYLSVSGNYVFVSGGSSGVRVLDVSDPASIVETGYFSYTGAGIRSDDVVYRDGYIYHCSEDKGFSILDPILESDPQVQIDITAGWNVFGVSAADFSLDPQTVFGSGEYAVAGRVGDGLAFLTGSPSMSMDTARGYWLYSDHGVSNVVVQGTTVSENSYKIDGLSAGWHAVASPFDTAIDWSSANVTITCGGSVQSLPPIYSWNGTVYTALEPGTGSSMAPWTGYWVYLAGSACSIDFTK